MPVASRNWEGKVLLTNLRVATIIYAGGGGVSEGSSGGFRAGHFERPGRPVQVERASLGGSEHS